MSTSAIFFLLAIGAVIWFALRGSNSNTKQRMPEPLSTRLSTRSPTSGTGHHWPSLGEFDFEVVGESHYQSTIARLAGNHSTEGAHTECIAELVPEDDNHYDQKAIAVRIQGQTVGYLSREDARSFRRRLAQKGIVGAVTTCDAAIAGGGTRRNGEKLFYGVKLDIKPFE